MLSLNRSALFPLAFLALVATNARGETPTPLLPSPISVDSLAWLGGCWASVGGEPGSGEMWTLPEGGTLFGISRTVRDGQTVAHEFMIIREQTTGTVFIAQPSGQAEAVFSMVSLGKHEVTFENPEHDFPQRVIYRSAGPRELVGRIEGMRNGELRGIDFPMRRAECP